MTKPVPNINRNLTAFILACLAAIGPFSIDTYLPAFPEIRASLNASQASLQQSLTAYLLPYCFMILWHGAISDSIGRRKTVLIGLAVYTLASIGCATAPNIQALLVCRGIQGLAAGAGMVVGRAMIRDLFEGAAAQRLMAQVQMIFGIAPAIAPIIGGWLLGLFNWHATLWFLAFFAIVLMILVWLYLPETLDPAKRQSLAPEKVLGNFKKVFSHKSMLPLAFTVGCNFGGFFLYVLAAPVFLLEHLQVSNQGFAWLFVPTVTGMILGSYTSRRLAGKRTPAQTVNLAYQVMFAATALNILICLFVQPGVPWSVIPVMIYNFGMALAMPTITLLALDLFPTMRGLVSSAQAFIQTLISTLSAGLVVPLLYHSPLRMAIGMAIFMLLGYIAWQKYTLDMLSCEQKSPS
jgi:MFS transporter, DHA1 family, multidrug resistance protein